MFKPDFLITPYEIKANPRLRPTDGDVYAIVYWLERLKEGRCIAGNDTIAEVACCSERNVKGALNRLEKEGYIQRIYLDKTRRHRKQIKTLMAYQRIQPMEPVEATLPAIAPEPKERPPGEIARAFFSGTEPELVEQAIINITKATGAPADDIIKEVHTFITYWTERNKSGTRQRWELEKTFEVPLRLQTWFRRKGMNVKQAAGAGVII